MAAELIAAFKGAIEGVAAFSALCPAGIHYSTAPQNEGPPTETVCVWSNNPALVDTFMGGAKRHEMVVTVEVFGPRDPGPAAVMAADTALFSGLHGTIVTSGLTAFDRAVIRCTAHGDETTYADAIGVRSEWVVTGFMT